MHWSGNKHFVWKSQIKVWGGGMRGSWDRRDQSRNVASRWGYSFGVVGVFLGTNQYLYSSRILSFLLAFFFFLSVSSEVPCSENNLHYIGLKKMHLLR